jgi:tRNA(Ile)-lysidine synthase
MLIDTVKKTIQKFRMLNRGDRVLVGVSGGPDSVCLLHILSQLSRAWKFDLGIAHLNHKLRGLDSEEDANFVQNLAERLNLPFYLEEVDTRAQIKRRGFSEEEGARILRYDFFCRQAKKIGAKKVALAHTKDDQAETVLMRLIKGAGPLGLCGMPALRNEKESIIIRPLFEIWREEILAYLKENNIAYRIDASNFSSAYLRNRIRNELLPYLSGEFNPNIKEVLTNTAESLAVAFEYLHKQGKRKFKSVTHKFNGRIILDGKKIKGFPEAIQREVFRQALRELKGDLRRIRYQHWKEFASLLYERPAGSVVDLPGEISIEKEKDKLIFSRKG